MALDPVQRGAMLVVIFNLWVLLPRAVPSGAWGEAVHKRPSPQDMYNLSKQASKKRVSVCKFNVTGAMYSCFCSGITVKLVYHTVMCLMLHLYSLGA